MKLALVFLLTFFVANANAQGNRPVKRGSVNVNAYVMPSMRALFNGVPQVGDSFAVQVTGDFTVHVDAANWENPSWDVYATQLSPGTFYIDGIQLRNNEPVLITQGLIPFKNMNFSFTESGSTSTAADNAPGAGATVLLYFAVHQGTNNSLVP